VSSGAFDIEQGLKKLSKQEQEAVRQGLEKAQAKGYIQLTELEYSTIRYLRAYLTEHRGDEAPHVLHFDGHGLFGKRCPNEQCRAIHKGIKVERCRLCGTELRDAQGYLAFESEDGKPDYVSAEELGALLQTTSFGDGLSQSQSITLAVLSACQSGMSVIGDSVFNGTAQNLISHRVPAVVGMQYSVTVDGAAKFAEQFYRSLGQKNSLAIAVSQGREAMGSSSQQWFRPVLYLRWRANEGGQLFARLPQTFIRHLSRKYLLGHSFTVACVIFALRFLGLLQSMELKAFDHLMQLRLLDEGADPRLLVIEITDNDLNAQVKRNEEGQGTLKDASLNRLLMKLEKYQPRLIGLDLYRDFETSANKPDLVTRLKNERLFAVCKVSETYGKKERVVAAGIAPPKEVIKGERFGFVDFVPDKDQVVRRFLMAQEKVSGDKCATTQSFSLVLARRYLELEASQSKKYEYKDPFETQSQLQIGNAVFEYLQPFTGGYQGVDFGGYQVLLNYRATGAEPEAIAKRVTLEDVFNDRLSEQDIRDKIVLIGITAKVAISDDWSTPYGTMSGVFVQAHMVSQILSFVKGERALLKVWFPGIEFFWIACWSLVGAGLAYYFRSSWRMVGFAGGATFVVLYTTCLSLLTWSNLWVPFIPSVIALFLAGGSVIFILYRPHRKP
jgi:CHASE2 domain-containing sensor protein